MHTTFRSLVLAIAAILTACGGGVEVDAGGNVVFTAYVTVPPVVITTPVVVIPVNGYPESCIVWEGHSNFTLYGYGYYGCPPLAGRDLVSLFESTFPDTYVDSWSIPHYGTVRITLR